MRAVEAKEYGLIDEVLERKKDNFSNRFQRIYGPWTIQGLFFVGKS